jgi:rhamnosyl/mannosyltransferase
MFVALAAMPAFPHLIVTHHSDVIKQRVLGRLFAPIERRVHQRTALIFTTSEAYVGGSQVLQALEGRVRALPFGLDLRPLLEPGPAALAWAERLRATHGEPLWLAVARLVYYKGLTTAIDALAQVPGRLVVIGTGPLEAELRARAVERGVADRIVWCGNVDVDCLIGAYRAATALWFPSNARSEGFGLVQVEAMASGCPVINTAIPHSGVPWVSRDGESGFTVPVGDAPALAAVSRRLLNERGLRDRLARQAVTRARHEFEDEIMARRSLEFYEQALERKPRRTSVPSRANAASVDLEVAG